MRHERWPRVCVTGAALAACAIAAVSGNFCLQGALPFVQQKFLGNTGFKVVPGHGAARHSFGYALGGAQAAFVQGFKPGGEIEAFHPARENGAFAIGLFHHIGSQTAEPADRQARRRSRGAPEGLERRGRAA